MVLKYIILIYIYDRDSSNYTDYTSYPLTHDVEGQPTIANVRVLIEP